MTDVVHLTPQRNTARILRSGVAARSRALSGVRGVFCMPVLASFTLTYQWVRELRRWHPGTLVAVHVRIPDDEPVSAGQVPRAAGVHRGVGRRDDPGAARLLPRSGRAGAAAAAHRLS
jgi:hypothetical protein